METHRAKKKHKFIEKAKQNNEFNTILCHELRTPLFAVSAISKSLLKSNTQKNQLEDLKILDRVATYILKLINDSLLLKKIDANELNYLEEYFDIDELVDNVFKTIKKHSEASLTPLDFKIADNVPKLFKGDSLKITQILINLIDNAIKFGNQKPVSLFISCLEKVDGTCVLSFQVKDQGTGISIENQGIIRNRFQQLESKSKEYGSGLGLSIVVQLLKIMDSYLVIDSKLNKGSTFKFELLLGLKDNNKINHKKSLNFSALKGLSVLIVDDNLVNQNITLKILAKKKIFAKAVKSGSEAIVLLKKEIFQVVIMDLYMPKMTGQEATEIIRSFNPNIPVIAHTGVDKKDQWKELEQAGFTALLNKPYIENDLYQILLETCKVEIA
jgi:CheY-like chemotaxis protein